MKPTKLALFLPVFLFASAASADDGSEWVKKVVDFTGDGVFLSRYWPVGTCEVRISRSVKDGVMLSLYEGGILSSGKADDELSMHLLPSDAVIGPLDQDAPSETEDTLAFGYVDEVETPGRHSVVIRKTGERRFKFTFQFESPSGERRTDSCEAVNRD